MLQMKQKKMPEENKKKKKTKIIQKHWNNYI